MVARRGHGTLRPAPLRKGTDPRRRRRDEGSRCGHLLRQILGQGLDGPRRRPDERRDRPPRHAGALDLRPRALGHPRRDPGLRQARRPRSPARARAWPATAPARRPGPGRLPPLDQPLAPLRRLHLPKPPPAPGLRRAGGRAPWLPDHLPALGPALRRPPAGEETLRLGYLGTRRSLSLWDDVPGVSFVGPDDWFTRAPELNAHLCLRENRGASGSTSRTPRSPPPPPARRCS